MTPFPPVANPHVHTWSAANRRYPSCRRRHPSLGLRPFVNVHMLNTYPRVRDRRCVYFGLSNGTANTRCVWSSLTYIWRTRGVTRIALRLLSRNQVIISIRIIMLRDKMNLNWQKWYKINVFICILIFLLQFEYVIFLIQRVLTKKGIIGKLYNQNLIYNNPYKNFPIFYT